MLSWGAGGSGVMAVDARDRACVTTLLLVTHTNKQGVASAGQLVLCQQADSRFIIFFCRLPMSKLNGVEIIWKGGEKEKKT